MDALYTHTQDTSLLDPDIQSLKEEHAEAVQQVMAETQVTDELMTLRFLRRAGFDPDSAVQYIQSMLEWREEAGIASLSASSEGVVDKLRSGLTHLHYFDRAMRPTIVIHMARNTKENIDASLATVALMVEQALAHAPLPHRQFSVISDMRGTGMGNYDLGMFKSILSLLMDKYPGALHRAYLIQPPWVFSGVWRVIKGLLDAHTREKVIFLGDNFADTLLQEYFPQCLLRSFGGCSDYAWDAGDDDDDDDVTLGPLYPVPIDVVESFITATAHVENAVHHTAQQREGLDEWDEWDDDDDEDDREGYFSPTDTSDEVPIDFDGTWFIAAFPIHSQPPKIRFHLTEPETMDRIAAHASATVAVAGGRDSLALHLKAATSADVHTAISLIRHDIAGLPIPNTTPTRTPTTTTT